MRCIPTVGMYIHRSRGIDISETWPSLGQMMAITSVSVRYEEPGRLSDPISRKLIVSLSVSGGRGVGFTPGTSAGGGAADVGKSRLKSTVAVGSGGWVGVGDGVSEGRMMSDGVTLDEVNSGACVGV